MDDGCVECRACEQACPMNLTIVGQRRDDGILPPPGCLIADGIPVSARVKVMPAPVMGKFEDARAMPTAVVGE